MTNDAGNRKNTYIDTEIDKILASLDDRCFEKFLSDKDNDVCKEHKKNIVKHLTESRFKKASVYRNPIRLFSWMIIPLP